MMKINMPLVAQNFEQKHYFMTGMIWKDKHLQILITFLLPVLVVLMV